MNNSVEQVRPLELLVGGLAARVLARHFALRAPGCRDVRLSRELLTIVRDAGRERLADQLEKGTTKDREARQVGRRARVLSASSNIARVMVVQNRILKPQATLTRRPELLQRLASTLEDAHQVARRVRDYRISRPPNLVEDGSLLRRAAALRGLADEVQRQRAGVDAVQLLSALASELDEAADNAQTTPSGTGRALALERCFEAALQIASVVRSRGELESTVHFAAVFKRLVAFNRALGMRASMEQAKQ